MEKTINGQVIRAQQLALTERVRFAIAIGVLLLHFGWILAGVIVFMLTGNFWLLASSVLLAYHVYKVFQYYFGSK